MSTSTARRPREKRAYDPGGSAHMGAYGARRRNDAARATYGRAFNADTNSGPGGGSARTGVFPLAAGSDMDRTQARRCHATLIVVVITLGISTITACAPAEPAPPSTPGAARQPVLAWIGGHELDLLAHAQAPSGVTLDRLQSSGVNGVVASTGLLDGARQPSSTIDLWRSVRNRGMELYLSTMIASPSAPFADLFDDSAWNSVTSRLQALAADARSGNANGLALDLENYGVSESMWSVAYPGNGRAADETRAKMRARAQQIAPTLASAGPLLIYPSSIASFPGSYNDVVATAAGNGTNVYADNMFPDFLRGLLDGGVQVTLIDGVFASGPQAPGRTWQSGTEESVSLATRAFPGLRASIMVWPDNPGVGTYSASEMRTAVDAGTRFSSGPVIIYEQTLAFGGLNYDWFATLDAIKAATGA
jgi:hypothetical protein